MIPERLKFRRKELKLTQDDIAKKLGITRQGYGHYETGRNEPDTETLIKLSEILNCSVDYLLGKSDNPKSEENTKNENLFFFNLEGLSKEEIEDIKRHIEYVKWKARQKENKNE